MSGPPDALPGSAASAGAELGRLRWRCRRGMKELDLLLQRWLAARHAQAAPALQDAFARLLEESDPQLVAWLFRRERPSDPATAALVDDILAHDG